MRRDEERRREEEKRRRPEEKGFRGGKEMGRRLEDDVRPHGDGRPAAVLSRPPLQRKDMGAIREREAEKERARQKELAREPHGKDAMPYGKDSYPKEPHGKETSARDSSRENYVDPHTRGFYTREAKEYSKDSFSNSKESSHSQDPYREDLSEKDYGKDPYHLWDTKEPVGKDVHDKEPIPREHHTRDHYDREALQKDLKEQRDSLPKELAKDTCPKDPKDSSASDFAYSTKSKGGKDAAEPQNKAFPPTSSISAKDAFCKESFPQEPQATKDPYDPLAKEPHFKEIPIKEPPSKDQKQAPPPAPSDSGASRRRELVFPMPMGLYGRLVGKEGTTIRDIRYRAGAEIVTEKGNYFCRVVIKGSEEEVSEARRLVLQTVMPIAEEEEEEREVRVRKGCTAFDGGAMQRMQAESHANITLQVRREDKEYDSILISGASTAVKKAWDLVCQAAIRQESAPPEPPARLVTLDNRASSEEESGEEASKCSSRGVESSYSDSGESGESESGESSYGEEDSNPENDPVGKRPDGVPSSTSVAGFARAKELSPPLDPRKQAAAAAAAGIAAGHGRTVPAAQALVAAEAPAIVDPPRESAEVPASVARSRPDFVPPPVQSQHQQHQPPQLQSSPQPQQPPKEQPKEQPPVKATAAASPAAQSVAVTSSAVANPGATAASPGASSRSVTQPAAADPAASSQPAASALASWAAWGSGALAAVTVAERQSAGYWLEPAVAVADADEAAGPGVTVEPAKPAKPILLQARSKAIAVRPHKPKVVPPPPSSSSRPYVLPAVTVSSSAPELGCAGGGSSWAPAPPAKPSALAWSSPGLGDGTRPRVVYPVPAGAASYVWPDI